MKVDTAVSAARRAPDAGMKKNPPESVAAHAVRAGHDHEYVDLVDEWGRQSFPASDPPANW